MGFQAARRGRRTLSREGHRLSRGNGSAWKVRPTLSPLRGKGAADSLRQQRNQLLPKMPDRWKITRRSGAFPALARGLATNSRRDGIVTDAPFYFFHSANKLSRFHMATSVLVYLRPNLAKETVFGLPGDGINGIMEALRKQKNEIRFGQVRHEEAAAFMACCYAKYTGAASAS